MLRSVLQCQMENGSSGECGLGDDCKLQLRARCAIVHFLSRNPDEPGGAFATLSHGMYTSAVSVVRDKTAVLYSGNADIAAPAASPIFGANQLLNEMGESVLFSKDKGLVCSVHDAI